MMRGRPGLVRKMGTGCAFSISVSFALAPTRFVSGYEEVEPSFTKGIPKRSDFHILGARVKHFSTLDFVLASPLPFSVRDILISSDAGANQQELRSVADGLGPLSTSPVSCDPEPSHRFVGKWFARRENGQSMDIADVETELPRLWDTRNKRLFSNSSFTAHSVLQKILAMARKDEEALRPEANPGSRKFECNVGWEWPPEGWVKANCDGAYKASSGLAGAGEASLNFYYAVTSVLLRQHTQELLITPSFSGHSTRMGTCLQLHPLLLVEFNSIPALFALSDSLCVNPLALLSCSSFSSTDFLTSGMR
ncbi:hypothetical protein RIF29_45465 [Crotalaria pallida]|uniref:Uncharacterized protein n=1 Tax=Crotalaria pallida TaxID=3830 RepID=A0AAN9E073_CROPI